MRTSRLHMTPRKKLVENVIENSQKYNKKITATCSYARKIIEKE